MGDNTQWFDPIKNLQTTEIFGGHQALPKHVQHLGFFVPPTDRHRIQTDQPLLAHVDRDGTGAGRGSLINTTGESSGDSLPPSLHEEGQKTWGEHFLWKLVMRRSSNRAQRWSTRPITTWCLSNAHHSSHLNTVFLYLSMSHIIIQENHSGELICFQIVFPPHSKYLSRRDFLGNQNHSGLLFLNCMILFIKYLS